jgi:hypothetical protein
LSDIFLSYSRKDRALAAALAEILTSQGWTIYWDRQLRAGEIFDEVLEREVTAARCVVVMWSSNSVSSQWVRNEADVGACRNALISVLIEAVQVPLAFRRVQAADLIGWKGDTTDTRLAELMHAIAFFLDGTDTKIPVAATGTGSIGPVARFEPATIETLERHLAEHVGPIAHSLVKASAAASPDLAGLYLDLVEHVPVAGRERFLRDCPSTSVQKAAPSKAGLDPPAEWVKQLKRDLAIYLGPITDVIVGRALRESASLEEVLKRVGSEILGEHDRQTFLRRWQR